MITSFFRYIVIIVLFAFFPINIVGQSANKNTMIDIKNNTEITAQNTTKGSYEFATIAIASFAFLTAIITLCYTIRTYYSQKQTQKNTAPLISKDTQFLVFQNICGILVNNYFNSVLFKYVLVNNKNYIHISDLDLISFKIPLEEVHLELFYGPIFKLINTDNIKLVDFSNKDSVFVVKNRLKDYNGYCSIIGSHFQTSSQNKKNLIKEIDKYLIVESLDLISHIRRCLLNLYDHNHNIKELLELNIKQASLYYNNIKDEYITKDDELFNKEWSAFHEFVNSYVVNFTYMLTTLDDDFISKKENLSEDEIKKEVGQKYKPTMLALIDIFFVKLWFAIHGINDNKNFFFFDNKILTRIK